MKKIKVVSLFDGIAGARQALKNLGIDCEYYAYEIDKYAIKVANTNHPDIIQCGSVVGTDFTKYKDVDLLVGGSPCQGFSFAGKQLNFDDPRSKLFFEFVRALKEIKPKYFLLENVKMKKEYQNVITEALGVEPIEINSALLTAQNRKRLYWTNVPKIEQPENKHIVLDDILESQGICGRVVGRRLNSKGKRDDYNYDIPIIQRFEPRLDSKSGTLTTVRKDNMIFVGGLEDGLRLKDGKFLSRNFREGSRIYSSEGKSATLTAQSKGGKGGYSGLYLIKDLIRTLTPTECETLQGFSKKYTDSIVKSQRYKALGNSFTVPVIEHILKNMELK